MRPIVYISDKLPFHRRSDHESSDIEYIWIEIKHDKRKPFLFNFVYRPSDSQQIWIDNYKLHLAQDDSINLDFYIFGDMNINFCTNSMTYVYNNQ